MHRPAPTANDAVVAADRFAKRGDFGPMTRRIVRFLALLSLFWPAVAMSGELTPTGAALGAVAVDPASVTVERATALSGDVPLATYVTAHTGTGKAMQRTNLGYWIPWDGRIASLVDNGFPAASDTIVFKVVKDEDMRAETFPIRVTLGYRTAGALKFGVFELRSQPTGAR